jgi:hypothetical protein
MAGGSQRDELRLGQVCTQILAYFGRYGHIVRTVHQQGGQVQMGHAGATIRQVGYARKLPGNSRVRLTEVAGELFTSSKSANWPAQL